MCMSKKSKQKKQEQKELEKEKNKERSKEQTQPEKKEAAEAHGIGHWLDHIKSDRKLQLMLVVSAGLLIMAVGIAVAVMLQPRVDTKKSTEKKSSNSEVNVNDEKPTVLPRHLDGIMVAAADANMVPACVMIENAAFSGVRPQSGISAAQVVYEIIVEGGITRWMAVFAGEKTDVVGPVRSSRDTYLEFVSELNCAYVHAGGSYLSMQAIQRFELRDIDGLREYQWFWRDSTKSSPHNFFTSTDNLYKAISEGHSWADPPTYSPWNFVDDEEIEDDELAKEESATEVNIAFGGSYDVQYRYNEQEKNYKRWNGGVEHIDKNTGKTLTARNIIIQKVPDGEYLPWKGLVNFSVTGEGEVYIARLGTLTKGTWEKKDRLARTQFFADDGEEIPLARGTTWVEIVPESRSFDWK